ncbi:hypothetical protein M8J75_002513 [Diaphorina citri]|nr:hypothetical protein M8J75_002513 [Diaphorina citri]
MIREVLVNILTDWGVLNKVVAVVTDNASKMTKAIADEFGKSCHLTCFAHSLNLVAETVLTDVTVQPMLNKVKDIVTFFKQSINAADDLRRQSDLKLIQSVNTRWNSTFYMLERFLSLAEKIGPILLKYNRAPTMVSGQDIGIIKEIMLVLKPLEMATRDVSGDSYCSSSSRIIPLINIVCTKINQVPCETEIGKQLKAAVITEFLSNRRFGFTELNKILAIATILDPRFKKLHFRNPCNVGSAVDKIKLEMKALQGQKGGQDTDSETSENAENDGHDDLWAIHTQLQKEKVNGICSKRYPRQFTNETRTGEDGYPTYRRRSPDDGGHHAIIHVNGEDVNMDNRWVVPYSPVLSRTLETHVNVEYCSSVKAIKYICKYINKGSDQATFAVSDATDEIQRFQSGRYICTSEAVYRILSFEIHDRYPAVMHLEVHLPDEQRIYFQPHSVREQMDRSTTLMAFFELCQTDSFAKSLLYCEVPSYFTYSRQRGWARRLRGQPVPGHPNIRRDSCIGRVYTVHPSSAERYYLRLLLHSIRGPTSFEALRTVNEVLQPTFQAACRELGLLEDDACWAETLREAAVSDSSRKLRDLFCVLIVFCTVSSPRDLWMEFRDHLAEEYN